MRLDRLLGSIEEFLPEKTAVDGDRIGLQIQGNREEIKKILITLELNDQVIEEAVKLKNDCIISFHPLIYNPLYSITESNRVGRLITKLIQNSIALIVIHTNFDAFSEGTSKILCDKLGLTFEDFLVPDDNMKNCGMGVIGRAKKPLTENELLDKIQKITNSPLRYATGKSGKLLERIAIVGGSGTSFMNQALAKKTDAFITADVSYHQFHAVKGEMTLIDPGHYEMEQFVPEALMNLLAEKLDIKEIETISLSEVHTNPVIYFPDYEYSQKQKHFLLNKLV